MIGRVTRHMLPHLSGVPHLHVNRPLLSNLKDEEISARAWQVCQAGVNSHAHEFAWTSLKNMPCLSVKVFSTNAVIGETIFNSPTRDGTAILRDRSDHAKVRLLAAQGIWTRDLPLCSQALLPTELIANPAAVKEEELSWCLRIYLRSVHSLISSTGAFFVSFCFVNMLNYS